MAKTITKQDILDLLERQSKEFDKRLEKERRNLIRKLAKLQVPWEGLWKGPINTLIEKVYLY